MAFGRRSRFKKISIDQRTEFLWSLDLDQKGYFGKGWTAERVITDNRSHGRSYAELNQSSVSSRRAKSKELSSDKQAVFLRDLKMHQESYFGKG